MTLRRRYQVRRPAERRKPPASVTGAEGQSRKRWPLERSVAITGIAATLIGSLLSAKIAADAALDSVRTQIAAETGRSWPGFIQIFSLPPMLMRKLLLR